MCLGLNPQWSLWRRSLHRTAVWVVNRRGNAGVAGSNGFCSNKHPLFLAGVGFYYVLELNCKIKLLTDLVLSFFRSIATLFHGNKSSGNDFFLSGFGMIFSIRIQDGVSDLHRPTATDEWKEAEQNEDDGDLNIKKVRKRPRVLIHPVKHNDNTACVTRWSYVRR